MTAVLTPTAAPASGRRLTRTPEFTLALIAAAGFVALAIATGGNLLSAGTLGLTATATSGLTVTFTSTSPSVCFRR